MFELILIAGLVYCLWLAHGIRRDPDNWVMDPHKQKAVFVIPRDLVLICSMAAICGGLLILGAFL